MRLEIDTESLERLMKQFTEKAEIAKYFMCKEIDLNKFVRKEYNVAYGELNETMKAQGRAIIKNGQFKMAERDSKVAMRLGELYCNQKSESNIERIVIVDDISKDGKS